MALKPMNPTHYPIGEQIFRTIREEGYLYVDKTGYVHELVNQGKYFFLSMPRHFGKSLLVSTLDEYFRGNRDVFEGLAIDRLEPEPWPTHPVFHIDFNAQRYETEKDLNKYFDTLLSGWERLYGKGDEEDTLTLRFQ